MNSTVNITPLVESAMRVAHNISATEDYESAESKIVIDAVLKSLRPYGQSDWAAEFGPQRRGNNYNWDRVYKAIEERKAEESKEKEPWETDDDLLGTYVAKPLTDEELEEFMSQPPDTETVAAGASEESSLHTKKRKIS